MNEIYTLKILKNTQSVQSVANISQNETPKGKPAPLLVPLPALKTQKTTPATSTPQPPAKEIESRPSFQKPRLSKYNSSSTSINFLGI